MTTVLPRKFAGTRNWLISPWVLILGLLTVGVFAAWMFGRLPWLYKTVTREWAAEAIYAVSALLVVLAARRVPRPAPGIGIVLFGAILWGIFSNQLWWLQDMGWLAQAHAWFEKYAVSPAFRAGLAEFAGLPYVPQLFVLWGSAVLYLVVGKVAEKYLGGVGPDTGSEKPHLDLLQKWPVQLFFWMLGVVTLVFYLLPAFAFWVIGPGTINVTDYMAAHASFPAVALIVLIAGFLPPRGKLPEKGTVASDPAKTRTKKGGPDLLLLFKELSQSDKKIGAIAFRKEDHSKPWYGGSKPIPQGSANQQKSLLESQIDLACEKEQIVSGTLATKDMLDALNSYEKATSKDWVNKVALIEDTLLDHKLILIAAALAHHLARGRNVVLMSDDRRIADLKEGLTRAMDHFMPATAYNWCDAARDEEQKTAIPNIMFGDCAAIIGRARVLLGETKARQTDLAKGNRAFFHRLGLVTVLDAHLLDFLELSRLLRMLSRWQDATGTRRAQLLFQCEPVENAPDAVYNALIGGTLNHKFRLVRNPANAQRVIVWENRGGDPNPVDTLAGEMWRLLTVAHLIDELHDEDQAAWSQLAARHNQSADPDLTFRIEALGRYDGEVNACFIDRDRGNLAAALMRDVAAPGDGHGLLVVLSDPLPIRDTLAKAILQEEKAPPAVDYSRFIDKFRPYLPRLPNASGGVQEMLRDIAALFLARRSAIPAHDVKDIVDKHMKGRLAGLNFDDLGIGDISRKLSAEGLNNLFDRMNGRTNIQLFTQSNALRSSTEKDMLSCTNLPKLRDIAFGADSADKVPLHLAPVDRGLLYDTGSTVVARGQRYRIRQIGANHKMDFEADTAGTGLDRRPQELFAKTYELTSAAPGKHVENQKKIHVFALVQYKRLTTVKTKRRLNSPTAADPGQNTKIVWNGSLAEAVFLRLACEDAAADAPERLAAALCLSLQDVIELKFPAVSHRISIVSPQLKHKHGMNSSLDEIRLSQISGNSAGVLERLRNATVHGQDLQNRPKGYVELLVLEDSDTTLGVVDTLEAAFGRLGTSDEDSLTTLWKDHLSILANKATKNNSMADWARARDLLTALGAK